MFKLFKGGECYTPDFIGKKDVLVACGKICKVEEAIPETGLWELEIFDCRDRILCPGFIDQHVHITGGGGEEGPASRIPELELSEVTLAGVSTVVGLLGADSLTRAIAGLLAKARALELEGINTYIYTGSYSVPTATLTGKVISDLAFIDKVIGVGEIAIADDRSSHPSPAQLKELAWETRVGGMIGGKAGVVHIHLGDGKKGMSPLFELIEESDFSISMFVPTHVNRNKALFSQALEYTGKGGNIDLTAGEISGKGYSVPDAVEHMKKSGVDMGRVTVSSDGNGSMPSRDGGRSGVGKVGKLLDDIRECILTAKVPPGIALQLVTANVARVLKLYPAKGAILPGSDADILVLHKDGFVIDKLLVKGEVLVDAGTPKRKGRYEKQV